MTMLPRRHSKHEVAWATTAGNHQFQTVDVKRQLFWLAEVSKRKSTIPMYYIKIKCHRMVGQCPVCPIGRAVADSMASLHPLTFDQRKKRELSVDDPVMVPDYSCSKAWQKGVILCRLGPVTYTVQVGGHDTEISYWPTEKYIARVQGFATLKSGRANLRIILP